LRNLTLRSFLLDFKLLEVISTRRSHASITKIARIFLEIITTFILINQKNDTKNYLYMKVSINLQY